MEGVKGLIVCCKGFRSKIVQQGSYDFSMVIAVLWLDQAENLEISQVLSFDVSAARSSAFSY